MAARTVTTDDLDRVKGELTDRIDRVVTKLDRVRGELTDRIDRVDTKLERLGNKLRGEMSEMRTALRGEMSEMEQRLIEHIADASVHTANVVVERVGQDLARHVAAVAEHSRAQMAVIDDKYRQLPERVERLEREVEARCPVAGTGDTGPPSAEDE